jgi:hypothetical protein
MKQNEIWQHGDIFMLGEITLFLFADTFADHKS